MPDCECGCGRQAGKSGHYLPGHDQRLRIQLEERAGGLLNVRALVEAAEAYVRGGSTTEELSRRVRYLFARAG